MSLEGARLTITRCTRAPYGPGNWRLFGSAALAFAGPAIRETSIQTHCAPRCYGYAEEHEAPRHFRRVHADLAAVSAERAAPARNSRTSCWRGRDFRSSRSRAGFGLTGRRLQREVVRVLAKNWTEERLAAHNRGRSTSTAGTPILARDGHGRMIAWAWPKEHGGRRAALPSRSHSSRKWRRGRRLIWPITSEKTIVARALFLHGSPEQRTEYLPAILRASVPSRSATSEPEQAPTWPPAHPAVRDGDDWIINGQKLW